MVGYGYPTTAAPGGMYGWPGTAGTVPYQGPYVYGGLAPSSMYAPPGAAQQMQQMQQMQPMQAMQPMQQMIQASQLHAGNGGGGLVRGPPAITAGATMPGLGAGLVAGAVGFPPMTHNPNGPGSPFDSTRMMPVGFGDAAGGAAAGEVTTPDELSELFGGMRPPGVSPSGMKDEREGTSKSKKKQDVVDGGKEADGGDGEDGKGEESKDRGRAPSHTVVCKDDDGRNTVANVDGNDVGDKDGVGGADPDVEKEVLAAVAAAVARSSRRQLSLGSNDRDQREPGGGGSSSDRRAGGDGVEAVPCYDRDRGECDNLCCAKTPLNQFFTRIARGDWGEMTTSNISPGTIFPRRFCVAFSSTHHVG